jgi:hypothetical protein
MLAAWAQLKLRESRAAVLQVRPATLSAIRLRPGFGRAPKPTLKTHPQTLNRQAKLKQHTNETEADAARARARLEKLQQALSRVEQQQAAAERRARAEGQQVAELEAKQAEYARSLDKCARKLAANGVAPEVGCNWWL